MVLPGARPGRRVLVPHHRALLEQVFQGAVERSEPTSPTSSPASWAALAGSTLVPSRPWAWVSSMARSSRSPSLFAWVLMVVLLWSPYVRRDILRQREGTNRCAGP